MFFKRKTATAVKKGLFTLLNALLPPRCLLCGKVVHSDNCLCAECFPKIDFINHPFCKKCGMPLSGVITTRDIYCPNCLQKKSSLRFCRSAIIYNEHSKKLILDFKFFDHIENKILLARWMKLAGRDIFEAGADLIVPVPLFYTRMLKRKYNQSAILAAALSDLCHIPADYKALKKIKHTKPQVNCNEEQRLHNVKNAFNVVFPEKVKGKRIILIDDVFTTGSTLRECAKVLKKAGAKSVDALTAARVCR